MNAPKWRMITTLPSEAFNFSAALLTWPTLCFAIEAYFMCIYLNRLLGLAICSPVLEDSPQASFASKQVLWLTLSQSCLRTDLLK
ncbi:hypothetical protein F5X68DRAFT_204985 [Plectosphaerella plurivora]|uniref:Uncharacterized protein n=1 Tax=Plectosphaerella plurivora TaxID=936078 RepID=A0A9P8VFS8_9PEZI|nr:hypothetical protein F5X68DRAFT_204985 [Plectosphaerella plurivora]